MEAVLKRSLVGLQISHEMRALPAPLDKQVKLAAVLQISQSCLNQYISGKRTPDADGLRKLCTLWPDAAGGQRILLAHLKDQIALSGIDQNAVKIEAAAEIDPHPEISADLALLKQESAAVPAVAAVVHAQAELIRQSYALNEMPAAQLHAKPGQLTPAELDVLKLTRRDSVSPRTATGQPRTVQGSGRAVKVLAKYAAEHAGKEPPNRGER